MFIFFLLRETTVLPIKLLLTINLNIQKLLSNSIFTRESSYCFQRILAIAILSVRLSHE